MHGGFPNLHSAAAESERPNSEYIAGPSVLGRSMCIFRQHTTSLVAPIQFLLESSMLGRVWQSLFLPSRSLGKLISQSYSSNGSKQKTIAAKSTITTRKSSCRCGNTLHWSSCQDSTCCLAITERVRDSNARSFHCSKVFEFPTGNRIRRLTFCKPVSGHPKIETSSPPYQNHSSPL